MSYKIESKMVPKPLKSDPLGCLDGFGDPFGEKRALRKSTMRKCSNFNGFWGRFGVQNGAKIVNKSNKNVD